MSGRPDSGSSTAGGLQDQVRRLLLDRGAGDKQALMRSEAATLDDQLSFEATQQAHCFESRDIREGLAAIRERRAPKFEGR